jgi:acetolactate synthase-1/2/3 large subunit
VAKRAPDPRRGRTVGRLIAAALADVGVKWAFTVPGESFLAVLDALPAAGITVIATRHEGGAAFMAEAVGQLTGAPAAVLGTRAVGAGNMSIGIHTARQNSTPMVALVGQVRREFLGREAFQEVDQVESFGRLAKWAGQVDDAASAAIIVGEGLSAMLSGRPGPVLFSLPEDVLDEPVPARARVAVRVARPPTPSAAAVDEVLALLSGAQRPAILAGFGVAAAGAGDELVALSEMLEVPVVAAWRRPIAFPNDHPHYLGVTGYGAANTVRPRLEKADALLVIGTRLNEISSFDYRIPTARTKWAHVDLEPRQEARAGLSPANIAIAGDAGTFLRTAIEQARGYKAPRERVGALAADRAAYLAASTFSDDRARPGQGVDPAHVVTTLQRVLAEDAVLMSDAGNFGLWLARGFRFGRQNGFLGNTSGAMGYGLPAAIAASLCEPTRQVVALCGDGGFAMTMNELETAVRTGAHPVVLVFDNRRYGTIAMHQANEGRANVATDLGAIDFAAAARAMGAQGGRVSRDAEFEPALRDALAADRPAVIQLEVDPRWVTPDRYA